MADYCMRNGALPLMLPHAKHRLSVKDIANSVDALLLQGGSDIAPESYGDKLIENGAWPGDRYRDLYEIELVHEFLNQKKPILGICRGHQLLNVALGGTLYQDTQTQREGAIKHRDPEIYDRLYHKMVIQPESLLANIYKTDGEVIINSIHHQAINILADTLKTEAICSEDNVIEAVQYTGNSFAYGLQWHPEFQLESETELLSPEPLMKYFLDQIKK